MKKAGLDSLDITLQAADSAFTCAVDTRSTVGELRSFLEMSR